MIPTDGGGLRKDEGKPRTDLIPTDALLELSKLYAVGATKYADRNWERGMPFSKVYGPLTRHLFKWWMGENIDSESGLSHMTHVAWNAIALMTYEIRHIGIDDRNIVAKEVINNGKEKEGPMLFMPDRVQF